VLADPTPPAVLSPEDWFQRINAMFNAPTRPAWQDRLPRPSTLLNRDGSTPKHISRYWTPRNRYLDTLWSYSVGDPPLPQLDPEYQDIFRDVIRKARSNYAPMCVNAMLDRMELQAISTLQDSDTNGDDLAAEIMEETGFASVSKDLFGYPLNLGEGYGMVVPGGAGDPVLSNGNPCPSIHAIDPRRCIGIPDWQNPTRLSAAVVHQYDPITWQYTAFMFLPGQKWTLTYNRGSAAWDLADAVPEKVEGLDAFGGIPIVRLDNMNGLGEYEPHLDLLDRINDVTLQRIIGFWYQALRQRAIKGDEDEDEDEYGETDDATADPAEAILESYRKLRAGPGSLWKFPKDFDIWESAQTDFGPLLNGKRDDVKEFAAVTSTPLHLITPDAANGSAEGAGLMRESATAKVRDRRARFAPGVKLLWRMVFTLAGEEKRSRRMRLHWGPIEFRTLAEQASASAQAVGTLSTEDRNERIWQMSPEDTARNIQRMTADALLGLPTTPGNAQPTPAPVAPQQQSATDVGAA
jgi:hypothetical protein